MADPKILGGLGKMGKRLLMTDAEKAAEKYAAGVHYADPLAPASMRMSEALGNVGAEGKTLNFTEADRSRVFGKNRGGVGFSGLQHYSLPHQEANTVWGFGNKATAEKKIRQNDPDNSLFTTFVGSPTQHKSNSVVIGDAIKEFQKSVKKGVVPREQIMLMNKRLNELTDQKTGARVFEDGFDLTDPSALNVANTFSRRAAVGDVMLGLGVKGPMTRLDFKKEFPDTKFVDGSKIENLLKRETDPDLVDANTYDVGNRLFVMNGKIIERPDLNEAFPVQVTGDDLGMKYQLVPPDKAMRDFYKAREGRVDKNGRPSPVSYYDLSRAEPSQLVDEDYLTFLQKEGYKKGGAVDIKAADARLAAAMGQRMAKGGSVDIKAADARLAQAMAQRMAGGGGAFKKIEFMADGGKLVKGAIKIGKRLLADEAPAINRDANLQNFLAKSQVKEPVFHASKADVKKFSPKHRTDVSNMGHHFGTAEQANFRTTQYDFDSQSPNIGKYHLNVENPLEVSHMASFAPDHLAEQLMDMNLLKPEAYDALSAKHKYDNVAIGDELVKVLRKNGYDGLKYANEREGQGFSYVPLNPTQIKSATGNRGTYDIEDADITKAEGGPAFKKIEFMAEGGVPHMADAGRVGRGMVKGVKRLFADRDVLPVESQAAKQARLNMMPTARIGLEAPGILIPSKMNNVREAVRNIKGNYGARRVERAADEIPNLERMYQEDAFKQAFTGDNAAAMMTIDPSRFEEFATPIGSTFTRPNSVRHTSAGDRVTFPEYLDYLKSLEGFDDVPFLEINKQLQGTMAKPYISGHEGRHRNRAMSQSGEKAGLVQLLPRSELREPFPRKTQEEYIEALKKELEMTGNIVLPQINKNQPHLPQRPAIDLPDIYAEGGPAFKTLQWQEPQHFDGGGIASPEENNTYAPESFFDSKRYGDIKKNAAEMFAETKQNLASDYDRLKNSPRARAQLAKIAAAQLAGFGPDLAHMGIDLVVDPLKDKFLEASPFAKILKTGLTGTSKIDKPAYRSVLEGPLKPSEFGGREPIGNIADLLKTKDGLPIGGSEHIIKRAQDAGLMYGSTTPMLDKDGRPSIDPETGEQIQIRTGRFSPVTEIGANVLGGYGLTKLAKGALGFGKNFKKGFDRGYARATAQAESPYLKELGYDSALDKQSVKLLGQQPQVMTALTGTPKGATYATKQEGPFFRVSPTTLDTSTAKSRGIREADELQSPTSVGGGAEQAGREVPQLLSPEEVGRIIADPTANQPLQIAQRFTKETQGTDFAMPDIPESSLAKQSAIGRAQQLAVEGSPEYKNAVFDAYAKQMPDLLEQVGAKNYDDLMEKAYRQMAKETDDQFQRLPYNFSYHRAGEGNYNGAMDMASDVHGNKHLYVYQGGDPHDFLNRMDKASGLNENEKFRAVHDLLGHAIYGNQFGPKGEEIAWAVHQQMYSPLARLAMTAETRGQNSMVNYSPLNANLKSEIAKYDNMAYEAKRRGDTALVNEINALKRQAYAGFEFAPNKAVLLPPEFVDPKFTGGMPDYLSAANRPAKGTESQSVLTHFSNDPNLQMLDPKRYGTGIKGAEAERLRDYEGGVRDRSYVYLGEPGTIAPESGLGVNRYRAESQNLYDITKDPLSFRALARESNRTPFTAKVNAGITSPLQEANDYERLVKEYGYEGMINPNASKPMGIMFKPTPVQPRARGGLTQLRAR